MTIRGGNIITVGETQLVERLQSQGPGSLNVPTEKIYELGNYESLFTIRDTPDISFSMESYDSSATLEAVLTGNDIADAGPFDLSKVVPLNITSPWKNGKDDSNPFEVDMSVALPYLYPESVSYRFAARENSSQTVQLRGDSIFYNPGPSFVQIVAGSGTAGQTITLDNPSGSYTDSGGTRYVLAVVVGKKRLTLGPDYTVTPGTITDGYSAGTVVTITEEVPATEEIKVVYHSNIVQTFPQTVHSAVAALPPAVRGRDIYVYVAPEGTAPANVTDATYLFTKVQSATVDWRATIERDDELGSAESFSVTLRAPEVSGSLVIRPDDARSFMKRLRDLTGVTTQGAAIGTNESVLKIINIVIKDPDGNTMKRLEIPDGRFTVPGYDARTEQTVDIDLTFESDGGKLLAHKA